MKKIFLKSNGLLKTLTYSVFFTFLFVLMGNVASAQSFSTTNMSDEAAPIIKEYEGSFVTKGQALSILETITAAIADDNGSNDAEEIELTLKRVFATQAGVSLKSGSDVIPALLKGYHAIENANANYDAPVNTIVILEYFAEEFSN